jgi:hypothetical protein
MSQQISEEYSFPLKPGMEKWKELKSHAEMTKALKLPSDVLNSMTTEALALTCLHYPLFSDLWAYDNLKDGFMQLRKDFNGFNELFRRIDARNALVKLYRKMNPNKIAEKTTLIDKGKYTEEFCRIELMLAQPELAAGISQAEKKDLLKESVLKHEQMLQHPEFDIRSIESNVYLQGKALIQLNENIKRNRKTDAFIQTSRFLDKDVILEIVSLSKEIINN